MRWLQHRRDRRDDLEFRLACREAAQAVVHATVAAREVTVVGFVGGRPAPVAGFGLLPAERAAVAAALRALTRPVTVPGAAPVRHPARRSCPSSPERPRVGDWCGFDVRLGPPVASGAELVVATSSGGFATGVLAVGCWEERPLLADDPVAASRLLQVRDGWVWLDGALLADPSGTVDAVLVDALGLRGGQPLRHELRHPPRR